MPPLSGSYRNARAFSAKELALQSKIEADSIVTAGILLSMFPEKHAGCDLPFFMRLAGWTEQDMSVVMHSDSTHWLAEAGQKTPEAMLPYIRGCEETAVGARSAWMATEVIPPQKCPSSYWEKTPVAVHTEHGTCTGFSSFAAKLLVHLCTSCTTAG